MDPTLYFSEFMFKAILIITLLGLGSASVFLILMFIKERKSKTLW